ncbi:hypothetical protein [Albidovulum sp.]
MEFLKFGKTLYSPDLKITDSEREKYTRAVDDFPTAAACFKKTSNSAPISTDTLEWGSLYSINALEVCIFRVAASMRSSRLLAEWLERNGLRGANISTVPENEMRWYDTTDEGTLVSAVLPHDKIPRSISGWFWPIRPIGASVGITLGADGSPVDVRATLNYK